MRIKSYFAPSVQAAIALARKEFGDGVTLVTSHVAAPENRGAGEYEVVFAIDEQLANSAPPAALLEKAVDAPKPETPSFSAFQDLLLQAVAARPSTEECLPEKLAHVRGCLIELGLEPAIVIQVMSLVERYLGIGTESVSSHPAPVYSFEAPSVTKSVSVYPSFEGVAGPEKQQSDIVSLLQVEHPEPPVPVPHFGPTAAELLFAECVTKAPGSGRTVS